MLDPMQRVLDVSSALHALERLSGGAADGTVLVEGPGFTTLFRLLRTELDDAAGEILLKPAPAN